MRELHRGRHVVVRAALAGGETYVIKTGPSAAAVARERRWYRSFAAAETGGEASRFIDEDLDDCALVFAVHPAASDARDYAVTRQRLPADFGAGVARRLAALHARDVTDAPRARIAGASTWSADAVQHAARLVACCTGVQAALPASALVHGDVRWENAIVCDGVREPSLIDWEDAGLGAPAWDVGCLLASFASFAIRADARFGGAGPAAAALRAMLRGQAADAWRAYRASSEPARDPSFLRDAVRCAGVRLAEAAFAPSASDLSLPEIVALAAASLEMLDDPAGAASRWYGLDDPVA